MEAWKMVYVEMRLYEVKVCGWPCVMEFAMKIINKSDTRCDCVFIGIGMIAPQVL